MVVAVGAPSSLAVRLLKSRYHLLVFSGEIGSMSITAQNAISRQF